MSHELATNARGEAEMAYMGEVPWHGLGAQLQPGATPEEAAEAAGMTWTADAASVRFDNGDDVVLFNKRKVLYRSDTRTPLSVVSSDYKVHQPQEIVKFFTELCAKTDATIETLGSLYDGRVIWAMARLGKDAEVRDDIIAPYLTLGTSYDMSLPTFASLNATRIVCRNTLELSFGEKKARRVRLPHSTSFDASKIRSGLNVSLDSWERFLMNARWLSDQPMTVSDMDAFLIKLLRPQTGEVLEDDVRKSKAFKSILALFNGGQLGSGQEAIAASRWGALNAVTQFIDHVKGKNQSARLMDAWFGEAAKFKNRALALLTA